jgi:ribonuclease PH
VALADAVTWLRARQRLAGEPLLGSVAAVSVGIVDGQPLLDLDYAEDSTAQVDLNVVASGDGKLVEVQGTAEGAPFDRADLDILLDLALRGCAELTALQAAALAEATA